MKKLHTKYLLALTLILMGVSWVFTEQLFAAGSVSFQATSPRVVRAGEQFQIVYSLNENVDDFSPPDFGEFRYLGGPSTGSSTSVNIINGKTTRTSSYTFTYYIQAPGKGGKYMIPPATASFKRDEIKSNALEIEVVGSSPQNSANNQQSGQQQMQSAGQKTQQSTANGDDIYVRLEFNKTSAYVGEQLTAQVKLYTKSSLSGIDQQFQGPSFAGFYRQNIDLPPLSSLEREKVGNDIYYTGVIQKVILYPQKTGEIVIDPFELLVEVQTQQRRRSQSFFDDFFGPQYQRKRINLTSKPVKLNIKSLPGNQSADFSGAVGTFSIKSSVNMTEASTNDAITFRVSVSGTGNVKLIEKVATGFPPTFDVFEPVKKVNLSKSNQGRSGTVTFEYTAIPRHAGTFDIEPFSLIYFDVKEKSYKTLSTVPYQITVHRSEGDTTTVVSSNLTKEDVELLGSDIRFIKSKTQLRAADNYIYGKLWFYAVYILALLLLVSLLLIRREQVRRNADRVKLRNRQAAKLTTKRLKTAQKLLKENDKQAYIDELEKALWMYLADKLNIPISELSKDNAQSILAKNNLDDDVVKEFFSIIDACQFARYAPGGEQGEMEDLLKKAQQVFIQIDQSL